MTNSLSSSIAMMTLAVIVGIGTLIIKDKTHSLEIQLSSVKSEIRHNKDDIHVLEAQWSVDTDPQALKRQAAQLLDMRPSVPSQMMALKSLREFDGQARINQARPSAPTMTVRAAVRRLTERDMRAVADESGWHDRK